MTDKTDGPPKASDAKRPHATLDLKATEVKPAEPPKPADASAAASASSTASAAKPSDKPQGQTQDAKAAAPGAAAAKPGAATASSAASSSAQQKSGGGIGRFFSHLAAGVLGGGIVYAGATLLPEAGFLPAGNRTADRLAALDQRLKSLEAKPAADPTIAKEVADARDRLAKLESLAATVTALKGTSDRIDGETKALTEKLANDPAEKEQADKIATLNERLNLIAQSAQASDGKIPQLAAITGKIADLESAIATQIATLRKAIPADIETRLAAAGEASETAKSGAQRLDRDVAQLRADQAKIAQRAETTRADIERLGAAVEAAKEETGKLSSQVGEVKSTIESRVAKPSDVSAAVSPVTQKIAALEQSLQGVVKSEEDRKSNAERIVLSLELQNLKRAVDRGAGYAAELAEVRKAAGDRIDLAALDRDKDTGVATLPALQEEFHSVMNAVIDADAEPADGSVVDRLLAGAKSVVRVRKVSHDATDTSAEAVVSRMSEALEAGQLGRVLDLAKTVPQRATAPMQDWLEKVSARHAIDKAMAAIEGQLKASLSGTAPAPAAPAAPAPAAAQPAPAKPTN